MKKKFTELSVEKMAPVSGKRLEAFDTLTPGLALRITEGGKKSCRWQRGSCSLR